MKAKPKQTDENLPRGSIVKDAVTGPEKETALKNIRDLSAKAGRSAKQLGLTELDIQKLINEP